MSLIKDLKTNPDNIFNMVEAIELFVPDKKSKYTNLLLRLMKSTPQIDDHSKEIIEHFVKTFPNLQREELSKLKPLQLMLLFVFVDRFFNPGDLENFRKFCEYNEMGYVDDTDLSRYRTIDEIMNQVNIAEVKVQSKEMEKEVVKVYEDDTWLMLRPLTYISSKKYGSNTKWCTTSESNPEYFLKYSNRGVLIYSMNKKNGYKVAAFHSLDKTEPEFSFWNQKDQRIDSMESELPLELIKVIKDVAFDKKAQTNRELMDKELISKEYKILRKYMTDSSITEIINRAPRRSRITEQEPTPIAENRLSNRIMDAIRRENWDAEETILSREDEEVEMELGTYEPRVETDNIHQVGELVNNLFADNGQIPQNN